MIKPEQDVVREKQKAVLGNRRAIRADQGAGTKAHAADSSDSVDGEGEKWRLERER